MVSSQVLRSDWSELDLPESLREKSVRPKYIASNQFGDLYLLDDENHWLAVIPGNGTAPRIAGGWGDEGELFSLPSDITASRGLDVLVCDNATHRILRFDRKLNFVGDMYLPDLSNGSLKFPFRIARNEFHEIMAATWGAWEVNVLTENGRLINVIGDATYGDDRFSRIQDMEVGADNELAIIDRGTRMFVLISREGRLKRKVPLPPGDVTVVHPWRDRWFIISRGGGVYLLSTDEDSFNEVPIQTTSGREVSISDCTVLRDVLYVADSLSGSILTAELKFLD